jgi:hypothetical protein
MMLARRFLSLLFIAAAALVVDALHDESVADWCIYAGVVGYYTGLAGNYDDKVGRESVDAFRFD